MTPGRWLIVALALSSCGCHGLRSASGRAGLPPEGQVRVLARRLQDDAGGVQWQWTVLGDRNWTQCRHSGTTFVLSGSYPLNSVRGSGGTHIWVMTIAVRKQAGSGGP